MKTSLIIVLIFFFLSPTLFGQKKDEPVKTKPGEQITVNKEYDDQGNLIRFDSTYSFEWRGDTMLAFPGGNPFPPDNFGDMGSLLNGFFSDSLHHFSPFDNEWDQNLFDRHNQILKEFNPSFPNKDFFNGFGFQPDSLNRIFWNDSLLNFHFNFDGFDFPDMTEFFKYFDEFDNHGQQFFNDDQQKEWNELMKKQQEEMEEFQKKWDSKNKSKPKADTKLQKI
jgi:hypothetical protein